MRSSRQLRILRIAVALFAALFFFQNCSDAVFSNDDTVVDSSTAGNATQTQHFRTVCASSLAAANSSLGPGAVIGNTSGSLIARASSVSLIHDIKGSVYIHASAPGARVDTIENVFGSVILCGVSVSAIKNIEGSVVIVDADLGSVDNVTGSVIVSGGQLLGPVSGSGGSIVTRP